MRLMTIHAWIAKYFADGCSPTEITIRRWIQTGSLPGMKLGGKWFVDENAWLAGGNDLVLRVLEAG